MDGARSPALLAFGGDSAIELLSAIVVLWRFRAHAVPEESENLAARIAAVLLFMLAASAKPRAAGLVRMSPVVRRGLDRYAVCLKV